MQESTVDIIKLVKEQQPEFLYLFEKQPKGLSHSEIQYRNFLKQEVVKTLKTEE